MERAHQLIVDTDNEVEVVFVCPERDCGRRVVVNRNRGDYTVIDRGDFFATHIGATGPITVRASV